MEAFLARLALLLLLGRAATEVLFPAPNRVIVVAGSLLFNKRPASRPLGNFTLDNTMANLARFDLGSGIWTASYEPELYLYGESNGVVWDIAVNTSSQPYNRLIVVGAFDTVARTSQVQFCSVGSWDGYVFGKVGEGLCPRGADSSAAMFIQTTALGNEGDLFVGGSFESRVWDGRHFVNVYNVAHFNDRSSSWLPLSGGPLTCDETCNPR